ncbi:MAG: response regulator transcription factor [Candidatus Acidiferrum sp.]
MIRILLVDDFELWRRFICSIVQKTPEFTIVCEVSDGLAAVQKANELKPDLILLDIGLPKLNGIAAARQICQIDPRSKILFISEDRSADIVREALRFGAGFLAKADACEELLPAIRAVTLGGRFFTSRLARPAFAEDSDALESARSL